MRIGERRLQSVSSGSRLGSGCSEPGTSCSRALPGRAAARGGPVQSAPNEARARVKVGQTAALDRQALMSRTLCGGAPVRSAPIGGLTAEPCAAYRSEALQPKPGGVLVGGPGSPCSSRGLLSYPDALARWRRECGVANVLGKGGLLKGEYC